MLQNSNVVCIGEHHLLDGDKAMRKKKTEVKTYKLFAVALSNAVYLPE